MLKKAYDAVLEFEEAVAPQEIPDEPTQLTTPQVEHRVSLMVEEIIEFKEAETLVEQADAIIDLIYFALGTCVKMGVEPGELFDIVQAANMAKVHPDGTIHYREDGKVLKPEGWEDPEDKLIKAIEGQAYRQKLKSIGHRVKGHHFVTGHKAPHA